MRKYVVLYCSRSADSLERWLLVKPSGTEKLREAVKMVSLLPTESNGLGGFYTKSISPIQLPKEKGSSALDIQIMLNSKAKTVDCI